MSRPALPQARGLTLIELLVAVAILAALAAVALPSFREMIARKRIEGISQELLTDLRLLKSQQLQRGRPVRIRFGANATSTCYILFVRGTSIQNCDCALTDAPACGDPTLPGVSTEIRTVQVPLSSGVTVRANRSMMELVGFNGLPTIETPLVATVAAISGAAGGEIQVSTNAVGLPSICSVSGPTSNIPACVVAPAE